MAREIKLPNVYGMWEVTTEGDCEGRTTRNLGTHEGYFDEVALALAGQAYYGLQLKQVQPSKIVNPVPKFPEVSVGLNIETGTWNLSPKERAVIISNWLTSNGRKVHVQEGTYYATVLLKTHMSEKDIARKAALAKLNDEDKKALGLSDLPE